MRLARYCGIIWLSGLCACFIAAKAADAPAIAVQIGDSLADVKQKLGNPNSELDVGNRMLIGYPQEEIVLVNGHVSEIDPISPTSVSRSSTAKPAASTSSAVPAPTATTPDTSTHPPDVTVTERVDGPGVITLIAHSDTNTDFTVTLNCDLSNMTPSHPLPYTADSGGEQTFVLLQLKRTDPTKAWNYATHFETKRGCIGNAKPADAVYQLPYLSTQTLRLGQGNFGKFSHFEGSQNEHAFDFTCPQGTVVCAARAGVVCGVRQDFTEGGTDEKFKSQGNYVIIRHDDGTYAEYFHIQHNGALVQLGQRVGAGQRIALSGATGFASGPHIHFAVFQVTDGKTRVTLPVKFKIGDEVLDTLKEGESY